MTDGEAWGQRTGGPRMVPPRDARGCAHPARRRRERRTGCEGPRTRAPSPGGIGHIADLGRWSQRGDGRWSRRCQTAPDHRPPPSPDPRAIAFRCRCPYVEPRVRTHRSRDTPGATWGVGHGSTGRTTRPSGTLGEPGGTEPVITSRVTTAIRPAGPSRGSVALIRLHPCLRHIAGGTFVSCAYRNGFDCQPGRAGRCVRTIPRRSSSSRMTRAAIASSGSRVTVPPSQSM